jgi:hypothetical protein
VTSVALVASLLTGAMFVFSGGAKLADQHDWLRQSADLGVDRCLASIVPWYEIVLGALLVSGAVRPWPAIIAVLTLLVFTVFIVRRILDGTRPPCACFGRASTRPLGPRHIARNSVLLVIAVLGVFAA